MSADMLDDSVLITGASGNIGSALALRYARPGSTLFLSCLEGNQLNDLATKCEKKGAKVFCTTLDVTDREGCEKWIKSADEEHPLGIVFANAGITEGNTGIENQELMRHIIDVNLIGVMNTVLPALPIMRERKRGHIGIVSSIAGFRGLPMSPAYSTSKAAAKAFAEALRPYLSTESIKVSVICPGYITGGLAEKNNFSMPFMVTPTRAADIIYRGMMHNKSRIVFPFPLHMAAWTLGALPPALTDRLLARITKNRKALR